MCGISAIINSEEVDLSYIKIMNQLISHRGPDGEGFYYHGNHLDRTIVRKLNTQLNESILITKETIYGRLALGHRRLAIIDVSENGLQPIWNHNKNLAIIFNGEIYNYKEIRNKLEKVGYTFKTDTDTEVILNAWEFYKEESLSMFEGMWAFIMYDKKNNEIIATRDRFGIKPLYYWLDKNNTIFFGSEIKQFTKHKNWLGKINSQRSYDFLVYSLTDHTDETMFDDVYHLPSGCIMKINLSEYALTNKRLPYTKWYNPELKTLNINYNEAVLEFKRLLKESVKKHLISDVEVGFALSGGLDSSSITCLANAQLDLPYQTFSACSNHEGYNERYWIDIVKNSIKGTLNIIDPDPEEAIRNIDMMLWHMDEPYQSQSAYFGYKIYEKAKEQNIKVILGGQGADEYLSGYGELKHFKNFIFLKQLNIRKLAIGLEIKNPKDAISKIYEFIMHVMTASNYEFSNSKMQKNFYKILSKVIENNLLKADLCYPKFQDKSTLLSLTSVLLHNTPLPRFLRWEDRVSMANSIESRVPFLDHKLVEFCQSLPVEYLDGIDRRKKILVDAMDGEIPREIQNRKDKMGFMTPEEPWIKGKERSKFKETLEKALSNTNGILNVYEGLKYYDKLANSEIPFSNTYYRLILFGSWMKIFDIKT